MAILSAVVASRCAISAASRSSRSPARSCRASSRFSSAKRAVAAEQRDQPRVLARVGRRTEAQFAFEDGERVHRHPHLEAEPRLGAVERGRRLLAQEIGDRGEKLRGGGTVLRHQRASFRSCSRSTSVSTARRPIEASSIDFTDPERCRHAWVRQITPQRTVPNTSHQCARDRDRPRCRRRSRRPTTAPRGCRSRRPACRPSRSASS